MNRICSKIKCGKKLTRHEQLCGNTCTACQKGPEVVGYVPKLHTAFILTPKNLAKLNARADEVKAYMSSYEAMAPILRVAIYNRIEKSLNNQHL
jgi:hypothetical protein